MKDADLALYRAKADGGGVYRFFELEMDARMQARRALELDLRKAIVNKEFELYYQPIIDEKAARSPAAKPSSAGITPKGAWCHLWSSSRSPKKPA